MYFYLSFKENALLAVSALRRSHFPLLNEAHAREKRIMLLKTLSKQTTDSNFCWSHICVITDMYQTILFHSSALTGNDEAECGVCRNIYKQGIFNSISVPMAAVIVSCWSVNKVSNTHKHDFLLSNHRAAGLSDERKQLKGLFNDAANQKFTFQDC